MGKNSNGVRFGAVIVGLVCCAGTPCALGQHALGDGQALDRNLSTQGTRNTPVRDLDALIRFNNSVVTGNALGGRAFRGDVGYRAPGDFRAPSGTDALYFFRRDATSAAIVAAGVRGTDALQYQFALSTGQAPPPVLGNFADMFISGLPRAGNPIHRPDIIQSVEQRVTTGSTAATALRSTADYNAQQALRPSVLAYRLDQDGRPSMLTASPLLGLNWTSMPATIDPSKPAATGPDRSAAPLTGLESVPSYVSNPIGLVESVAQSRVDMRAQAPRAVTEELKRVIDEYAKRAPAADTPGSPNAQPGDGRVRAALNIDEELERLRRRLAGVPEPTEKAAESGIEKAKDTLRPMTLQELVDPATGQVNAEVLKALQAVRPVIRSLKPEAPAEADTYAAHMTRGESLLKAGKYYDAEDSFVRALALQPGDPLASIGRVNAQLGAGTFVSAAENLRTFFTNHPEMIGTRYDASLLPTPLASETRAKQLRIVISDPTSGIGKEAGMLLAYLGYQRHDPKVVKEGLEAMAAKTYPEQTADVTLLALLQKIWMEGVKEEGGTQEPQAEEAK